MVLPGFAVAMPVSATPELCALARDKPGRDVQKRLSSAEFLGKRALLSVCTRLRWHSKKRDECVSLLDTGGAIDVKDLVRGGAVTIKQGHVT